MSCGSLVVRARTLCLSMRIVSLVMSAVRRPMRCTNYTAECGRNRHGGEKTSGPGRLGRAGCKTGLRSGRRGRSSGPGLRTEPAEEQTCARGRSVRLLKIGKYEVNNIDEHYGPTRIHQAGFSPRHRRDDRAGTTILKLTSAF